MKRRRTCCCGCGCAHVLLIIAIAVFVWLTMGLYAIQPIGALPEGVTLVVWRSSNEPFFNSPDAMCLKAQGSVSLLCRGIAVANAPTDRTIIKLPYKEWAYLLSTGGRQFER